MSSAGCSNPPPIFDTRRFWIVRAHSSGPTGTKQLRGDEDLVVTELYQVGIQFDAPKLIIVAFTPGGMKPACPGLVGVAHGESVTIVEVVSAGAATT